MDDLQRFQFGVDSDTQPENNLLYHYTNSQGLFGICNTGTLWATKLQFLNDVKEFGHAVEIAKNEISQRKSKDGISNDEEVICNVLDSLLTNMNGANTFIVSLSEVPDLLSQWRAYGGKGGFSIGFNYSDLHVLAREQYFRLLKCIYDIEQQKKLINILIDKIVARYLENPPMYQQYKELAQLQNEFYSPFLLMATTMKHPSFQEEKEWRLIGGPFAYNSTNAKWRPKENMLLPYYIFNLAQRSDLAINEVFIGPNNRRDQVIDSTQSFLHTINESWKVKHSDSPFLPEN